MVFSSTLFLVYFLPIVLGVYLIIPKNLKNYFLLISSLLFYAWGEVVFCGIMIGISTTNFFLVQKMYLKTGTSRKLFLIICIALNLSVLIYFKYANFILFNLNQTLNAISIGDISWTKVILPIGVSFYTFHSLTYIIDVYRGDTECQKKYTNYLLYIFLFPQLIAGPIVKYNAIEKQIDSRQESNALFISGFIRFSVGLAKKVLIANVLGEYAKLLMYPENHELVSTASMWIGMLSYTFQIYFDFSAYSDMAIGIGQFFGFSLPENFDRPYTSFSISQFWRKWHITLGDFMKNYLYIPLGGNKFSKVKMFRNLIIVFTLSGLWHGDNWTFIVWGVYHGFWLILDRIFLEKLLSKYKFFAHLLTFVLVLIGWVFFQADSLKVALDQLTILFSFQDLTLPEINNFMFYTVFLTFAALICLLGFSQGAKKFSSRFISTDSTISQIYLKVFISVLLFILSFAEIVGSDFNPFIYFKF